MLSKSVVTVRNRMPVLFLAAAVSLAMIAGCADNQPLEADSGILSEDVDMSRGQGAAGAAGVGITSSHSAAEVIRAVTAASARFHAVKQAERAGYEMDPHCVYVPGVGGMGHHFIKGELIDPEYNPLMPEALMYEPDKNGNLKLIGVEYIVLNIGQDHPHFGDQPFNIGGVPPLMAANVPHWSLHVWLWKENPNGMFAPMNPDVSCPM
ncbi:MAG: hypothetical protein LC662_11640 [Rhodothermaceae bacterium]|nr:hypothetical protein [Rhodothermaceae bacterium]